MIGLLPGLVGMDVLDEKQVMLRSSLLWGLLSLHVLHKYAEQIISMERPQEASYSDDGDSCVPPNQTICN